MSNRYYKELDCYRKILSIISNLNTDTQKINAIKHLIYNQFEHYPNIHIPCPVGDKTDLLKEV